ncbi:MAG TPA: prepilin-type N-terminal cleavage/methylation domain-containing protein [Epsilonproteobacteria bacterium]|nr:prepilin-type N-terminal cleavage/methylation domain-containing protein [Campylobacterota bacterium]
MTQSKKAFTMIELVFVIVVIGILASVAIPKLAATRDDAVITKARTTIATVRNALAMERQKRILRGEFSEITAVGDGTNVFGNFHDANGDTGTAVLEYTVKSENKKDRWSFSNDEYIFKSTLGDTKFKVDGGKFVCVDESSHGCKQLTN